MAPSARFEDLRRRTRTVRFKTTAAAVLVVGGVLMVSAVAAVVLLRRSLVDDIRRTAVIRADAVEETLGTGAIGTTIRIGNQEDEFVQVLDPSGEVVAASPNVLGDPALISLAPGESRRLDVPFEDDPFVAIATGVVTPDGERTILVGRTIESAIESGRVLVNLLTVGLPLLLAVVAMVTWRVTGRALAPVESIRERVDEISSRDLHRRVPSPNSGDEIARLAATMNEMLDRLERGQSRQRRFVSDASHELRSPVASIRQQVEVALAHPDRASLQELAGGVLEEDLRIQRLVEDLLLLAQMDERAGGRVEEVDLDDLAFEEMDRVRQLSDKHIDAARLSGAKVDGNRRQLQRLVGNLLENAVRHARSRIVVALASNDGEVVLRVDDDGPGVPPQDRERIFERFVRLEQARDRATGGSGLGLAIVAEVAATHGGTVEALASAEGGGRFEVRLPAAG